MSLYIVATPIGNLKDISERALIILRFVEIVIVEKWSDSIKLLNHFAIKPQKLLTYDERNRKKITPEILKLLQTQDAALMSSAGTPAMSDPGADLVRECYEHNISVIPVPGPSASAAAISVCGFRGSFLFVGFLPIRLSHRKKIFVQAREAMQNIVFFESTYRIKKTLLEITENFPEAILFLGKEMTKKFETYLRLSPTQILEKFEADKNFSKGEFTIIVHFPTP